MEDERTKKCGKCGRTLPLGAFAYNLNGGMQRQSWCRECSRQDRRRRRQERKE